ncbi:MAG: DUF554 domain-containing protein [Syntrophomonadaceae bacterium]|jgi:uncharacterized membrane protein YqgA involved in biofilm formation
MTGTIINAAAIAAAGLVGLLLRRGIAGNVSNSIQDGLALLVLIIGVKYAFQAESPAVIGLSLALGAWLGEWWQWEHKLEVVGTKIQGLFSSGESSFVKGFVSASLLFCVGAMGVVGSLEDGLTGNYEILLVKSMLDGIFSIIFAASMGVGVLFSSIPVLIYQGFISLGAGFIKPLVSDPMLNNITALGGVLIAGLGLNLLGLTRIRVANLLPGLVLVPFIMLLFQNLPL